MPFLFVDIMDPHDKRIDTDVYTEWANVISLQTMQSKQDVCSNLICSVLRGCLLARLLFFIISCECEYIYWHNWLHYFRWMEMCVCVCVFAWLFFVSLNVTGPGDLFQYLHVKKLSRPFSILLIYFSLFIFIYYLCCCCCLAFVSRARVFKLFLFARFL